MKNEVVIAAGCRTAIGSLGGQFRDLTALDLSIPVLQELTARASFSPAVIDDVIWGCSYQRTYQENNLARVALVKAGLPVTEPGVTIHRNCTSSMSSVQMAYYQIKAGEAAESNEQFITRVKRVAEEFGREIATPDEIRAILGLK